MYGVINWLIIGAMALALSAAPTDSQAKSMPDILNLDSLESLYGPVRFDHAGHINRSKDCADCHHHTAGTLVENKNCVRCHKNSAATENVACRGCHAAHPFSAEALRGTDRHLYHTDKPGLKGAYHINCIRCHKKIAGPVGCEDCHSLKNEGKAFYRVGEYTPKKSKDHEKHEGH